MTDYLLSQTLSARYYQPDRFPHISETTNAAPGSDKDHTNEQRSTSEPEPSEDRVRKRGRPRMSSGHTSPNDRRAQIRAAQRTYRRKKETMFQDLKTRVAELEDSMNRISDSLSKFYHMAIQSDLHLTHPYLFQQLNSTVSQVKREAKSPTRGSLSAGELHGFGLAAVPSARAANDVFTFGYTMNRNTGGNGTFDGRVQGTPSARYTPCSYPGSLPKPIERPLNGNSPLTCSFNESTFARRLHRYCIEYAYRLFTDPRTDPKDIYRVFRLVSCIRQEDKMSRYLASLVRAGPKESPEMPEVPFYSIGGAGTHYYPMQSDGKPLDPENRRLPSRVLSSMPGSAQEPETKPLPEKRQELLKMYGLDGTWLDCRDVQVYLEEKGFFLDGSPCLSATPPTENQQNLRNTPLNHSKGMTMDRDVPQKPNSPPLRHFDRCARTPEITVGAAGQSSWVLNVEEFVQALLKNMVILGRAPGFRMTDVEAAFTLAAKVSSN
ncbi:hypothetical protein BDV28DRAFT_85030 [Aspergillus coremiiformis]|uniref:BZIP domain-containing protein n=1 Tax=Aspergillus coremiiformis TaxID=138285 RepID=A0A5N6ZC12_9EURO|nr:hypothetical protein BDV28DRAFT_85030 [Aspergillus coremiiformis]